ncbi:MAG: SDR family oxidoreductase [Thermomicrobiales bacterium]
MQALVTGGAGFIGSHLVERLVGDGARVCVLDNLAGGCPANLDAVRDDVEVVRADVRDKAAVERAAIGREVVFHQAAEISVPRSVADPATTYAVNVMGTLNVLLAARAAGCRRVVVASSSAVYGESPELPRHERMLPDPISPYAASKQAGEDLCAVFSRAYGLEAVALRYFNVYGPRQDPASPYAAVIPRFLAALRGGIAPTIYGDGEQTRDFVYVSDVVEANLLAATAAGVAGNAYNVAGGQAITLNALLATLSDLVGADVAPIYAPTRAGDIRHSSADVSAARHDLGFASRVSLAEGLGRMLAAEPVLTGVVSARTSLVARSDKM